MIHEFDPWFNYRATEYLSQKVGELGWYGGMCDFMNWCACCSACRLELLLPHLLLCFSCRYDYMSWYPIGRPVGRTIYPGMQVTAVAIHETMKSMDGPLMAGLTEMLGLPNPFDGVSLNDVCVLIPAAFGGVASMLTAAFTTEATCSRNAGIAAAAVMAVLPAHLMRSVAGGYDNESIAMTAIICTFYLWSRSLRTEESWKVFGPLTGLSYFYMVAVWGGYIFVLNVIATHAALLVLLGMYSRNLHRSYSLFFIVGTFGAVQIPIVGWQPFQSLEQVSAVLVFLGLQLCELLAVGHRVLELRGFKLFQYRAAVVSVAVGLSAYGLMNIPDGFIGPLSARIRGLFVKHTHTGNPLVDSVAEHQATPPSVFEQYFPVIHHYAMFGIVPLLLSSRTKAKTFVLLQAAVAMYFTRKMIRLVLVLSLGASVLMGALIGMTVDWTARQFIPAILREDAAKLEAAEQADEGEKELGKEIGQKYIKQEDEDGTGKSIGEKYIEMAENSPRPEKSDDGVGKEIGEKYLAMADPEAEGEALAAKLYRLVLFVPLKLWGLLQAIYNFPLVRLVRMLIGVVLVGTVVLGCLDESYQKQGMKRVRRVMKNVNLAIDNHTSYGKPFKKKWFPDTLQGGKAYWDMCQAMAPQMSEPQIMMRGRQQDGSEMMIDDFREAYWWLRDNTPEDARIMAWWDYGYQITGVANRTTIADGNTWNHEHIALLGKCLTSTQAKSHKIVRHLADYVLAWSTSHAGMMGDDIAKSPHMARIGGSVYKDINPDEWGQDHYGRPSEKMRTSLLYTIINHKVDKMLGKPAGKDGAPVELEIDPKSKKPFYTEAYTSKNYMVRIYKVTRVSQKSKKWCAENPGQYPPSLEPVLAKRESFEQIHGLSLDDASEMWELAGEVLENFLTNLGMKGKKAGKWRRWLEKNLESWGDKAAKKSKDLLK